MQKSSIYVRMIRHQGVVNSRYVAEVNADPDFHPAGTIVCEPAPPGTGDDITFTYAGNRYMDEGEWTPRE